MVLKIEKTDFLPLQGCEVFAQGGCVVVDHDFLASASGKKEAC
jgi:hypothetical protein